MRIPAVLLTFAIAISAWGLTEDTNASSTTDGTPTTQVQDVASNTLAGIVGGIATRLGDGCSYEGRTEFGLNSEVTFTFINGTEESDKGFSVWKVPEGTTTDDIAAARRMFHLVDFDEGFHEPYLPTGPGREPDSVSEVSIVLNRPGLHALVCFQLIEEDENLGQDYAASLITVGG